MIRYFAQVPSCLKASSVCQCRVHIFIHAQNNTPRWVQHVNKTSPVTASLLFSLSLPLLIMSVCTSKEEVTHYGVSARAVPISLSGSICIWMWTCLLFSTMWAAEAERWNDWAKSAELSLCLCRFSASRVELLSIPSSMSHISALWCFSIALTCFDEKLKAGGGKRHYLEIQCAWSFDEKDLKKKINKNHKWENGRWYHSYLLQVHLVWAVPWFAKFPRALFLQRDHHNVVSPSERKA